MNEKNTRWVSAHAAAHYEVSADLITGRCGCTMCAAVSLGVSGGRIRLVLTEKMGRCPVTYSRVEVSAGGELRRLTFGGSETVTVPADGSEMVSDPAELSVEAGDKLTLWVYCSEGSSTTAANIECTVVRGDMCGEDIIDGAMEPLCGYARMEVETENEEACAIAAFGDSITAMELWTAPLRERMSRERPQTALLNLGVGGCRMLRDSGHPEHPDVLFYGRAGLSRFEGDCLSQRGLKGVIIALGINDLGAPGTNPGNKPMSEFPTIEQMQEGYLELTSRCRDSGLKVACATITPLKGVDTYRQEVEQMRQAVNGWIRTCGLFDMVLDFDAAVGQGEDMPLNPEYDSGDHIHPNKAGGVAMADSVDVKELLEALIG